MTNTLDGTVSRIDPRRGVADDDPRRAGRRPGERRRRCAQRVGEQRVRRHGRPHRPAARHRRQAAHDRQPARRASRSSTGRCGSASPRPGAQPSRRHAAHPRSRRAVRSRPDLDPASHRTAPPATTRCITNDGLVAFRRVGGRPGWTLVPDLARRCPPRPTAAAPTASACARASATRRERSSARRTSAASSSASFHGGADARRGLLRRHRRRPRLRERARQLRPLARDRRRRRCRHDHLPPHRPRPRLPRQARAAVGRRRAAAAAACPAASRAAGNRPVRSRGSTPRRLRLVRNPHFHVVGDGRPDGYPDEITIDSAPISATAVRAVERGQADYCRGRSPWHRADGRSTRCAPATRVSSTEPGSRRTIFAFLNTRVAAVRQHRRAAGAQLRGRPPAAARVDGRRRFAAADLPDPARRTSPATGRTAPTPRTPAAGGRGAPPTSRGPGAWSPARTRAACTSRSGPRARCSTARRASSHGCSTSSAIAPRRGSSQGDVLHLCRRLAPPGTDRRDLLGVADYPAASRLPAVALQLRRRARRSGQRQLVGVLRPRQPTGSWTARSGCRPTTRAADAAVGAGRSAARRPGRRCCRSRTPSRSIVVSRRVGDYQYSPQDGVLYDQLWVR